MSVSQSDEATPTYSIAADEEACCGIDHYKTRLSLRNCCCGIDHYTRVVMVKKRFCCIFTILIHVSAVEGNSCETTDNKECPADKPQCWLDDEECKFCAGGRDSSGVSGLYGGTQATCNECKKGKFRAKGSDKPCQPCSAGKFPAASVTL